jgi:alpha/beta superfamily hydrolase
MSFIGFMTYYTHFLDPFQRQRVSPKIPLPLDTPSSPQTSMEPPESPTFMMGGYSYGAMITANLPPLKDILSAFSAPGVGSTAAKIRSRAQELAEEQNTVLRSIMAAKIELNGDTSPRRSLGIRVGYSEPGDHRRSHDSRHSLHLDEAEELIRKGVHDLLAKTKLGGKSGKSSPIEPRIRGQDGADEEKYLPAVSGLVTPRVAYLLVSPLQGVITNLATMNFKSSSVAGFFAKKAKPSEGTEASKGIDTEITVEESKLVEFPTLAVYGEQDGFISVKKMRDWTRRLQDSPRTHFTAHEIAVAGHFWVEERVAYDMRDLVGGFASDLIAETKPLLNGRDMAGSAAKAT